MHIFRRLAGNILFKIFLAILALSFVFFGVSGFILGNPNSWVVKVGNTTVGLNTFNKSMQNERERILAANKSEEAMKYLDSDQFKSDVLGRTVNRIMIEKLHDDFGIEASRKLILEMVAKDSNFKNKEGKFDREAFKKFLAKNGLNEEKYVSEVANDITATMIIQTMSMAAPINYAMLLEEENFKQEKRIADVITISDKDVHRDHVAGHDVGDCGFLGIPALQRHFAGVIAFRNNPHQPPLVHDDHGPHTVIGQQTERLKNGD